MDADKGMVVVVNPDGDDLPLSDGDKVAAVMPAAVQTRTCRKCGMVDTDGFVSDVVMCDSCGTLVAKGPSPCAGCGAGIDQIRTQLYAGCENCKGRVQRTCEGVANGAIRLKGSAGSQDPKEPLLLCQRREERVEEADAFFELRRAHR